MKSQIKAALLLAAALGAGTASAAISVSGFTPASAGDVADAITLEDFSGFTFAGGAGEILAGASLPGQYLAPLFDKTDYAFVPKGGTASVNLATLFGNSVNEIQLLWGSPDKGNKLTIDGYGDVFGGDTTSGTGKNAESFVLVLSKGAGDSWGNLAFSSTSNSFEFDLGAVSAVPEPESYAMMLAGLGALGFLARRRKSQD